MEKDSIIKRILSFVIAFILMMSIIISALSIFLKTTAFDSNFYIQITKEQETSEKMHMLLQRNLKYNLTVNNIDSKVAENIITENEVQEELEKYITEVIQYFSTGENRTTPINISNYNSRLNENLDEYIKEKNIKVNDVTQKNIDLLKKQIKSMITNTIQLVNIDMISQSSTISKIAKMTSLFNKILYLAPIGFSMLLMLILMLIWIGESTKGAKWIGSAFLASGLILLVFSISGYKSGFYNDLLINIMYIKTFIVEVTKLSFIKLIKYGVVLFVIGIATIVPELIRISKLQKVIKVRKYTVKKED